jgi:hypothetical protein
MVVGMGLLGPMREHIRLLGHRRDWRVVNMPVQQHLGGHVVAVALQPLEVDRIDGPGLWKAHILVANDFDEPFGRQCVNHA